MSQRTITVCDACKHEGLEAGHTVVTVAGERARRVRDRIPGGRNALDLCDECVDSLSAWLNGRGTSSAPIDTTKEAEDHALAWVSG